MQLITSSEYYPARKLNNTLTSDVSRGTKKAIPKSRKVPLSYWLKTVSNGISAWWKNAYLKNSS